MLFIFWCTYEVSGSTLTFELEDRAKECFYEDVDRGTNFTVQFHVISGGNYDVDAELMDPSKKVIFSVDRSPMHSFFVEDARKGAYRICFSNSFSTLTHKIVSLSWFNGTDEAHWANVGSPSIDTTTSTPHNFEIVYQTCEALKLLMCNVNSLSNFNEYLITGIV
ncbi:unnamed protein product [Trichobilharzia regenti]|nr:unnamed protein product [Trichobilharzia regenti]